MEPTNVSKTSRVAMILIVGITLILGVVIGIFGFSYLVGIEREKTGITETVATLPQSSLAQRVEELEGQLESVTSQDEEARLKRVLALTNMRLDTAGSNDLLREVAANNGYPSYERGLAAQLIPDVYLTRTAQTPAYAMRYMFVVEPYTSMITEGDNDLQKTWNGIRQAYEYAASIHPLPIAEYRLAEWYIQSSVNLPQQNNEEKIAKAIEHFRRGNELLDSFVQGLSFEDSHMEVQAYWLKGHVAGGIYALNNEAEYREAAVEAFDEVHELIASGNTFNNGIEAELLWADLYHALFLAQLGDASYSGRISELLSDIVSRQNSTYGFFRRFEFWAKEGPMLQHQRDEKEDVLALSAYSEDFANLLTSFGVQ